ncbi:DUF4097 family beta strand repeat-containing protein [Emticicia sp. 17c]|uniref:DUF4097 family beta strand repeat-containing protein n=1 Tax=Emticicia sp. 17c TaxID=3127704 RepID=UPI00301D14EA
MKKNYDIPKLTYLLFLLLGSQLTFAQTTLQVVTKNIEKKFTGSTSLKVDADKADIEIITWDKDEIKVNMELISKHPDRAVAKADLEVMKYVADKLEKEVVLRNYLLIQKGTQKPVSNFKAKYLIYMPENLEVTVLNNFGKVFIQGKYAQLNVKSEFCILDLQKTDANLKLDAYYGELHSKNLTGVITIKSERSELFFQHLGGTNKINAQYGKVEIESVANLKALSINASKAEISLKVPLQNYGFSIVSKYGKVLVPESFNWIQNNSNTKSVTYNLSAATKISIQNSFGNISIN